MKRIDPDTIVDWASAAFLVVAALSLAGFMIALVIGFFSQI